MSDTEFQPISLPPTVFYPPFNITRASHYILTVRDLDVSKAFYCGVLGLLVSDEDAQTVYLRGAEEACHHSLILRQSMGAPECEAIGFRVLTEAELDLAYDWAVGQGLDPHWIEAPYQGRTLRLRDPAGTPVELCAHMPVLERRMDNGGGRLHLAKRLDHYQVLNPKIEACTAFYASIGFRISDVIVVDGALEACFLWRKGSVSDLVLMEGDGPRLHHAAFFVRNVGDILRVCDNVGQKGFAPMTVEEGPGRHGMDGAYYVYLRDPDGHRVELFDGHYQTIDAELPPLQYRPEQAAPPWGRPTLSSWFEEGTGFSSTQQIAAPRPRNAPTMEGYVRGKSR